MSVVRLVVATRSSRPPASQPPCILPEAPLSLSLCHLSVGAYTVRLLFVSVVYSVSSHSWKMYRYTVEERAFIVRTYWKTESIKLCQQQFLEKIIEHEMCVLILSTTFVGSNSHSDKNSERYYYKCR